MPAKLILNLNGATISEHELSTESISIGRKPENDVVVDPPAAPGGGRCRRPVAKPGGAGRFPLGDDPGRGGLVFPVGLDSLPAGIR